jgi:spermidine/putrescine ABC transporter ATP-binding subunit
MTLLGPSGCGKTTTLRLIAGFIAPTGGTIRLGDEDVTHLPPYRRELGMVFQDYALFPHLPVRDNIGFGLKERGARKVQIDRRVDELLGLIRLPGIADRYPSELSGGQAQRVAFARAIAHPPRVLLMDEPLAALDLKLREAMQTELRRLQQKLHITTVFVTHDQAEAMTMSDRIAVMNQGRIEQIGTAEEIYQKPRTRFVAGFIGQINLIDGLVLESQDGIANVHVDENRTVRVYDPKGVAAGERRAIAVRPESVRLLNGNVAPEANALEGRVISRAFNGSTLKVLVDIGRENLLMLDDRPQYLRSAEVGTVVRIGWQPEDAILLDG